MFNIPLLLLSIFSIIILSFDSMMSMMEYCTLVNECINLTSWFLLLHVTHKFDYVT